MAFRESDGEFLWQHTHEKLAAGRANDWPYQGVASSPLVEGTARLLRQQPRRGVVPRHQRVPRRQERRPVTDEKLTGERDADVIWSFDMIEEVGLVPAQPGELVAGELRRSDLRQHVERTGRRATSTSRRRRRRRSSRSTRTPASWCGRTTRSAIASCTGSGRRRRSARSAASIRSSARRATAGCAATRR